MRNKTIRTYILVTLSIAALSFSACESNSSVASNASSEVSIQATDSKEESNSITPSEEASSTEESAVESSEEPATIIDFDALAAIDSNTERFAKAQDMFEEIKENSDEHMDDALKLLNVMMQCKAEPFGDEQSLETLRTRLDKTLQECKASYCKVMQQDNGSLKADFYNQYDNLVAKYSHYGEAEEESVHHYYTETGNFLYSEKIVKGKKEKGPSYQYDAQGHLTQASNMVDGTHWGALGYNDYGGDDIFSICNADNIQLEYDSDGKLSKIKWKSHGKGTKTSQAELFYYESGCLEKTIFDGWEYDDWGDGDGQWIYICSDEEKGRQICWDLSDSLGYSVPLWLIDPTYTEKENRVPFYELDTSKELYQYKLVLRASNGSAGQSEEAAPKDGTLHLPGHIMAGNRFSQVTLKQDLGNDMTYCISFRVDHTSFKKIDFYGLEKSLIYKILVTID